MSSALRLLDRVGWPRRLAVARVLVDAVRDGAPTPVPGGLPAGGLPAAWPPAGGVRAAELAAAARFHGVAGYVHRLLARSPGADPVLRRAIDDLRLGGLELHLRALRELPELRAALDGAGVPWLVVKGPVLAETLHERPDLRAYSDLDVVVPAPAFGDAVDALERAGATVSARNWEHRLEHLSGEVPVVMPSGMHVDLHWHLLNDRETRASFGLSMPELFARACEVTLRDEVVRTLDAVDTLLSVALHTVLSGGDRLVWLKDLDLLARRDAIDREVAVERANDAGLGIVVETVLAKTRSLLGGSPDRARLRGLRGSAAWSGLAAVARRLPPAPLARGGGSVDRIVSRSTRADLPSSARELARKAGRWRPGTREASTGHDDPRARRAYLVAVARAG